MSSVYIIGCYSTEIKRWPEKSIKDLTRMAYLGALEDCGIDPGEIESVWFSNAGQGNRDPQSEDIALRWGQMNVRGQMAFAPLVDEGLLSVGVPCINVEGACASGSLALNGAWKDVLSGQSQVVLAIGVEKTYYPQVHTAALESFAGGVDMTVFHETMKQYEEICRESGKEWGTGKNRSIFMDFYAALAAWHMWRWGTTREQIAAVAAKNHWHGSMNPKAQYQFEVPIDKVLADWEVSWPLTRAMCAPLGDGAAASILCSEDYFKKLPPAVKSRAVKILASTLGGGRKRTMYDPSITAILAEKAYRAAGITPEDVNVAEVHDATAFGEILQIEGLGFCPIGQGGPFSESGATTLGGKIPVNVSGGLESKGHPIGATGLSQVYEIVVQLREEAGKRQVPGARIGLVENGGGIISFDEAAVGITILSKVE